MARPRIHPPGENRLARSRALLVERGGKQVNIRLEPEAVAALARLRREHDYATDAAAINAVLLAAAR